MPKSKRNIIRLTEYTSILIVLFLTIFNLISFSKKVQVLGATTEDIPSASEKISYFEGIIMENPLYLDAYYELVQLNIEESNFNKATEYFKIAQAINPNSQIIKSLENNLNIEN